MAFSGESFVTPLKLEDPSQECLNWAKEHLNEISETKCQVLSDFRDLIYSRGECTPHKTDDEFLLRFLRARYFNLERAHQLIVNYYNFKENNPKYCKNVDISKLLKLFDAHILSIAPCREDNGRRVTIFRINAWNTNEYTIDELLQVAVLIGEIGAIEQQTQILGAICIFDLGGLSLQHAKYMTPSFAQKLVQIMVTSAPVRIHSLHIVNQPFMFSIIYKLFQPFLNEEMKKRIFLHGNSRKSLHTHISPKYLPESYEGTHSEYSFAPWFNLIKTEKKIEGELCALSYIYTESEPS